MRLTSSNLAVRLACVKSLQSCLTLCDCQAPLSMGYFRQASWSELPHPPPGNLLNPGIKLKSPASPALLVDSLLCGLVEMEAHASTLAWRISWMEETGGLQSMGSLRVGDNWATSLSLFTFMHWRRKWQPTPVFLPGESQGQGSLVGCRLWGLTESDSAEVI